MQLDGLTCNCSGGRMSTKFSCSLMTCLISVLKHGDGVGDLASHLGGGGGGEGE